MIVIFVHMETGEKKVYRVSEYVAEPTVPTLRGTGSGGSGFYDPYPYPSVPMSITHVGSHTPAIH